ncbi:MAG TPA: thermonuclease family protein [Candidatus Levybacteria bacterium]|nr:thermonuclease family protein [Candidatus Levybacteria bacterium]
MMKKASFFITLIGIFILTATLIHNELQTKPTLLTVTELTSTPTPTTHIDLSPTQSPDVLGQKNFEEATIVSTVDGDTVRLSNGKTLRYIGIDTPETVDPRREVGCFGKEASNYNKVLTTGKTVYLEKDISDTDRYGRLLRYVYLQSGEMVNEMLVREGYAYASAYPPDVKYQDKLEVLEKEARDNNRGLWGSCQSSISPTPDPTTFSCDCTKSCSQITTCQEATFQLTSCGCKSLDGNNDGIACNSLCR